MLRKKCTALKDADRQSKTKEVGLSSCLSVVGATICLRYSVAYTLIMHVPISNLFLNFNEILIFCTCKMSLDQNEYLGNYGYLSSRSSDLLNGVSLIPCFSSLLHKYWEILFHSWHPEDRAGKTLSSITYNNWLISVFVLLSQLLKWLRKSHYKNVKKIEVTDLWKISFPVSCRYVYHLPSEEQQSC